MPKVPTSGIRVQTAMQWLYETLILGKASPVPWGYAGAGPHHFGGGSPNMRWLYVACGVVAGAEDWRERALNRYALEAVEGHGTTEPLTPSHSPLHEGPHGAIAYHCHRIGDHELRDHALSWLQAEYGFLEPCLLERTVFRKGRNGKDRAEVIQDPWTAGARAVQDDIVNGFNTSEGRAQFMAAVREEKPKPRRSQTYLAALCVAALPQELRARIATPPKKWPRVQGGLHIAAWKETGEFYCVFDSLEISHGGTRAAGFQGVTRWIERAGDPDRIKSYPPNPDILIEPPLGRPKEKEERNDA